MVLRSIVKIDESKCNGCGKCVPSCAEGAIQIVNGKAKLVSDTYCDGLGACLGHCPQDAITIEQREANEFDEAAAHKHVEHMKVAQEVGKKMACGCPGMMSKTLKKDDGPKAQSGPLQNTPSQLGHWPVQLKLLSPEAQYLKNSDLLVTADCVPFAMGDFHNTLLKGHTVAVGCPKLDDAQLYINKLADIIKFNDLRSLTVVHMEVPCCTALTRIVGEAVVLSGKDMNFEDVTIGLRGEVLSREKVRVNACTNT